MDHQDLVIDDWVWAALIGRVIDLLGGPVRAKRVAASDSQRAQNIRAQIMASAKRFAFDYLTDPRYRGLGALGHPLEDILPRRLPDLRREKSVPSLVKLRSDYDRALDAAKAAKGQLGKLHTPAAFREAMLTTFPDARRWLTDRGNPSFPETPAAAALGVVAGRYNLSRDTLHRMVHHWPRGKALIAWERRAGLDLDVVAAIQDSLRSAETAPHREQRPRRAARKLK